MRWTDYNDAEGRPEDNSFATEGQAAQAADENLIGTSYGTNKDETGPESGAIAAQDSRAGADSNSNDQNPDLSSTDSDLVSGDFGQMTERRY